jgi:hypothetical protein
MLLDKRLRRSFLKDERHVRCGIPKMLWLRLSLNYVWRKLSTTLSLLASCLLSCSMQNIPQRLGRL